MPSFKRDDEEVESRDRSADDRINDQRFMDDFDPNAPQLKLVIPENLKKPGMTYRFCPIKLGIVNDLSQLESQKLQGWKVVKNKDGSDYIIHSNMVLEMPESLYKQRYVVSKQNRAMKFTQHAANNEFMRQAQKHSNVVRNYGFSNKVDMEI